MHEQPEAARLALHNYESSLGCFPFGVLLNAPNATGGCPVMYRHTAQAFLLSTIEQGNLHNSINFSLGAYNPENITSYSTKVTSYVCPSDLPATAQVGFSQGSYAGMAGTTELWRYGYGYGGYNADICGKIVGNGTFLINRTRKISELIDGTSSTVVMGETSRFRNEPASLNNFWTAGDWYFDGIGNGVRSAAIAYSTVKINAPAHSDVVYSYIDGMGPFNWFLDPKAQTYGQFGFRSLHPGGANFLMGDGSVKFLKETMAIKDFWALSTIGSGELIPGDAY